MKDLKTMINFLVISFFVLPLAIWKVVDIITWIVKNVDISIG